MYVQWNGEGIEDVSALGTKEWIYVRMETQRQNESSKSMKEGRLRGLKRMYEGRERQRQRLK